MRCLLIDKTTGRYLALTACFFLLLTLLPGMLVLLKSGQHLPPQPIYHGNLNKPSVAITCNVFWGEEYLPAMLDTLDKYNVKATFFIGGTWAKENPELLKRIAAAGHEIGNHSYSHPHSSRLSLEDNKRQIIQAEDIIAGCTGKRTRLYAPPYGEFNDTVLVAAGELGYTTIMWSIDTIDWQLPPKELIISRVMKKLHNGAIILLHPTAPTAQALPELIERIQGSGYTIAPVSVIIH
jgi:probable sporulation protein (polysaccharide deacetylase family)